MKIAEVVSYLEHFAPPDLQESYDNAGLLTGNAEWECSGVIVSLDTTEEVINEAIAKGCNLVVAHHPIIFSGLKRLNGKSYIEKTVIKSIKHDVAIYAMHTNLDNVKAGVNARMAERVGLLNCSILSPKPGMLRKLSVYAPADNAQAVRDAIFLAGGGHIGNYSACSFNIPGTGTFNGGKDTHPFVGIPGKMHEEPEVKIEVTFPSWLEANILKEMFKVHPYEEVAYDIVSINNKYQDIGAGMTGMLPEALTEIDFLDLVTAAFKLKAVKHSPLLGKPIKKIALCGGAGSFLISNALHSGADVYITSDLKYHEYFDANSSILILDIGHYESEQFTIDLLYDILREKFPTFAIQKTGTLTNPVNYHFSRGSV